MASGDAPNGHTDENTYVETKSMTAEENHARKLYVNSKVALAGVGDEAELFYKAAKSFLAVHHEAIAQRDLQIQVLRAELLRLHRISGPEDSGEPTDAQGNHVHVGDEERQGNVVNGNDSAHHVAVDNNDAILVAGLGRSAESMSGSDGLIYGDPGKVRDKMESIWSSCIKVVQSVMEVDLPEDYLSKWNPAHWTALEDKLPSVGAIPALSSNGTAAKRLRGFITMAVVAQTLEEHILTPNYLLEEDDELRYILRSLMDVQRKTSLRELLLSASDEANRKEKVKGKRVLASVEDINQTLESLLPGDVLSKLISELKPELNNATLAWESVQRYRDHYEVNASVSKTPWDWKSASFTDDSISLLDVNSTAFAEDEAVLVVFPRACVIDRSRKPSYTAIFPGIILQKSQTELKEGVSSQAIVFEGSSEEGKAADATTSSGEAEVEQEETPNSQPPEGDASKEGENQSG